jgi:hypothetical protein
MLVDHRTDRLRPGTLHAHLDLYEKNGFAAQAARLSFDSSVSVHWADRRLRSIRHRPGALCR